MIDMIGTFIFGWIWDNTGGRLIRRRQLSKLTRGENVVIPGLARQDGDGLSPLFAWLRLSSGGRIEAVSNRDGSGKIVLLVAGDATAWKWRRTRRGECSQYRKFASAVEIERVGQIVVIIFCESFVKVLASIFRADGELVSSST